MFPRMADKCESGNVPRQASLREGFKNGPHYRFVTTRGFTPRESVALGLQEETGARADFKLKPLFVDLHDTTPFTCAVSRQVGQRLMKNEDAFNMNDVLAQLRSRGNRAYLHQHSTGEESDDEDNVAEESNDVPLVENFDLVRRRRRRSSSETEMDLSLTYELIYIVMMCLLSSCHRALGESLFEVVQRSGELVRLACMTLPHKYLLQSCCKHPMPNGSRFLDLFPCVTW